MQEQGIKAGVVQLRRRIGGHTEYGYYGGLVAGATLTIAYEMSDAAYEVTLTGSSSSWSISGSGIYQKTNGSWSAVSSVTLESTIGKG